MRQAYRDIRHAAILDGKRLAVKHAAPAAGNSRKGVRRMVEADKYCVDVLKQTYAVRRAIEKMEAKMLEGHLHTCVVEGIREGRDDAVLSELSELYEMAGK